MLNLPVKKKCNYCGKEFVTAHKAYNALYCSEECKKAAKAEYMKEYKKEQDDKKYYSSKKVNKELAADALEAFKQGISYGQYQGRKMLQEEKKKHAKDIHK